MDPAIVAQIQQRLDDVTRDARVVIPLAIESGSRAWICISSKPRAHAAAAADAR